MPLVHEGPDPAMIEFIRDIEKAAYDRVHELVEQDPNPASGELWMTVEKV